MFEVQDLKFATLATVSRCGMVWFSEEVVSMDMCFENYLNKLRYVSLDEVEAAASGPARPRGPSAMTTSITADIDDVVSPNLTVGFDLLCYFLCYICKV